MTIGEKKIVKLMKEKDNKAWLRNNQIVITNAQGIWGLWLNASMQGEYTLQEKNTFPNSFICLSESMESQTEWMLIDKSSFKKMLNKHMQKAKEMDTMCLYGDREKGIIQAKYLLKMIDVIESPSIAINHTMAFIKGSNGYAVIAGVRNPTAPYVIGEQESGEIRN